jgi:CheY-like chemotaxis protein
MGMHPHVPGGEVGAGSVTEARRRVLVVDDMADAADSMAWLLDAWGYDAEAFYRGETALASAYTCRPEVVLLDIAMPGMDGFRVARALREQPGGETVVIIAVSGYGPATCGDRAREAGIDHYLVKPIDLDELQALVALSVAPEPVDSQPIGPPWSAPTRDGASRRLRTPRARSRQRVVTATPDP